MRLSGVLVLSAVITSPLTSFAQQPGLQEYIPAILEFISTVLIGFLIGIAFLLFVINIIRYFVIDGANEKTRSDARMYAIYALLAFVILILFWGLINLIGSSTGLGGTAPLTPDYLRAPEVTPVGGSGASGSNGGPPTQEGFWPSM